MAMRHDPHHDNRRNEIPAPSRMDQHEAREQPSCNYGQINPRIHDRYRTPSNSTGDDAMSMTEQQAMTSLTKKKELQAASDYLMKAYGILRLMGDHHTKEVWSVIKSIESDIWWDETTERPVRQSTTSGANL